MRAAAVIWALGAAVLLGGCLEPGDPVLSERDNVAPTLVKVEPNIQAGQLVDPNGALQVTFSEPMDVRSLRPGIWIEDEGGQRLAVVIETPPPGSAPIAVQPTDVPWKVTVKPQSPLQANGSYRLVLDTVLTDTAGNPLVEAGGAIARLVIPFRTNP